MKKYLITLLLVTFIIPSITLASWWNPISWFNNWSFSNNNDKTEILEQKIKDLEDKLNQISTTTLTETVQDNKATSTSFISDTEKIPVKKEISPKIVAPVITPQINKPVTSTMTAPTVIEQKTIQTSIDKGIDVRCDVSKKTDIVKGDSVRVRLYDLNIGISNYDINWGSNLNNILNKNEAIFTFDKIGPQSISITVTRVDDGVKKDIKCLEVVIPCDNESCLTADEKRILILKDIIKEVDSWYDNEIRYLSAHESCTISESIIRSLEYKYNLLGGNDIPEFSKQLDCANDVGPLSYKEKIQLLLNTLIK